MNKEDTYKKSSASWEDFEGLQSKSKVSWSNSKDDIWAAMDERLKEPAHEEPKIRTLPVFKYAAAAIFVLLMGVTGVLRFYSESYQTEAGEHIAVNLPDGSSVELNAESSLKYYPYWWKFERKLAMNGEAFFDVAKGKKFVVRSSNGKTRVLGTSFNIYSRDNDYRVNCITGKVQVTASNKKVILLPNEQAVLNQSGNIEVKQETKKKASISWIDGKFFFTSVPLQQAIDEVERQYGVKVWIEVSNDLNYTGNFSRDLSVEEVLNYVCKSLGVNFEKKQEGVYQIIQNN